MIVIDVETKTTYEVVANRSGENQQICPRCSQDRKKQKVKCFSYNFELGVGHCSHCDLKVVEKKEMKPTPKAYKIPEWTNVTELPDKVVNWFKQRGISQQTLLDAKVGSGEEYMPQTDNLQRCIKFPYFRNGEIVNIKYRDAAKNFKLTSGAELIFFNLDSLEGEKTAIITEGEIDCLSYLESGFKAVVSVPNGASKGSLKMEYLDNCWQHFEHLETIYLATDDDEAGRVLQEELARRLGKERCKKVTFFGYKDANDLLKAEPTRLKETIDEAREYAIDGVFTSKDISEDIWRLFENGVERGATAGMDGLDELISFELGYMTVITGVPSHGKSSLLDQIIVGLNVNSGWRGAFYSPENWPIHIHHSRLASKFIGKWFNRMDREEVQYCIDYFSENLYFVMPENAHTIDSLLETILQMIKKYGIQFFVIDAWNKMEHKFTNSETQYISESLDKLDFFCKRHKVHLFLVAHPTKMKKNEKDDTVNVPTLYDVSGSANFYNKTANGLCVYKRKIENETYINEVYVQKVKFEHWGKEGMRTYQFDKSNGRFYFSQPNSNPLLPIPKMVQSSIPIPQAQSQKVEIDMEKYKIKENTSFLNKYPDADEFEATNDNEPAPF